MNRQPVSAEQWAALRALREGANPTFVRLGAASRIHHSTVRIQAKRESWVEQNFKRTPARPADTLVAAARSPASGDPEAVPEGWNDMAPADRLQWLNAFVSRQVAEIAVSAEAQGGALDKARMDAVWSMIRMVERSETLAQERAADKETGTDAELAARLRQLDDRIVELAQAHAEWLVGGNDRQAMG